MQNSGRMIGVGVLFGQTVRRATVRVRTERTGGSNGETAMKRLFLLFALLLPTTLFAATFVVTSEDYDSIVGTSYSLSEAIRGSFNTTGPLPANLSTSDIGPTGSKLLLGWHYS